MPKGTIMDIRKVQQALNDKGFNPGLIDGVMGPKTEFAIVQFKQSIGLRARPYLGPITLSKLFGKTVKHSPSGRYVRDGVPWVNELGRHLGLHERTNYKTLSDWLRSDGATLGDPRKWPWCGDAMQTAIRLTLPNEPWPGRVGLNPYLARNWLSFGVKCKMAYGAMIVIWRGKRNGSSGHIATVVGYDPKRKRVRIRGGNQSNRISDTWVSEHRVLGYRKPSTWKKELPPVPIMNSRGAVVSTNEA